MMLRRARNAGFAVALCAALSGGVWGIVHASENWHRGIYAGMHGNDAKKLVGAQMINQLGSDGVGLRYTGSLKTHSLGGFGPQERVYKFVSPTGRKYCGIETQAGDNFVVTVISDCKL